jgi:uncharacterized protein
MKAFINAWANTVIKFRLAIILMTVTLMGVSIPSIMSIHYDNSTESYFVEGDSNLIAFNRMLDLFGDNEYLSIGVDAKAGDKDLFNVDAIEVIAEITEFLEDHEVVTQVRSLSKYQYTHSDDGAMAVDDLFEDIDELADTPTLLNQARNIILGEQNVLGTLITHDLQHTRITARVEYQAKTTEFKVKLLSDFYQFIEEKNYAAQGYNLALSGQPLFSERFETITKQDNELIYPIMAIVMICLLLISFRSVSGMTLPWLVIISSIMIVQGIQGLLGIPHTVVESALVPTLMIIGIGISVHVLVEFYHFRAKDQQAKEAAKSTIIALWKPAFFTAFTTSIGFVALSVTDLTPVREFALLGGIAPIVMFIMAMTLMPAVLSYINAFSKHTNAVVERGLITKLTQVVPDFTYKFRYAFILLGLSLVVFSAVTVPQMKVDTNIVNYFKEDNTVRVDMLYFDERYNGILNIDVIVDSGENGGVKEPAFLTRIEALQLDLEAMEDTGNVTSLVDFIKQIGQSLNDNDDAFYAIPESRQAVSQYLFMYDNSAPDEDLTDAKDFDERYLRISVPIKNMDASDMSMALAHIKTLLSDNYSDLTVELTGGMVMLNAQDTYTSEGMVKSFSVALLVIALCFFVLFRSIKYGFLALIPSIVPIMVAGGVMVVLDIPLNLGTMIVGAMTMGIAVDDAIHVMNRYLSAVKQGNSTHDAIAIAMNESGRAVVFTSIVLVLGFSVMLLGSFIPYIYTGLFAAIIMLLALIGDLFILPALLYIVDGKKQTQPDAKTAQVKT